MKHIEPLNGFWLNGEITSATQLLFYLGYDDLKTTARFYYELQNENGVMLGNGNIEITGEQYQSWDGTNESAWDFAANKLGLIFIEK